MPTRRVTLDVIEEVLRMRHPYGRPQREIARTCGLSAGAVNQLRRCAALADLGWPLRADLASEGLLEQLYRLLVGWSWDALDFAAVRKPLSRRKSLTLP